MKITLNEKTKSKNAIANFNIDFGNGISINRIELIKNPKDDKNLFLTKQSSFQDTKGEWVNVTEVYFDGNAEVVKTIIAEVVKQLPSTLTF